MKNQLNKALTLIEKAQQDDEFMFEYADHNIATGDSTMDYSAYWFDLDGDYVLIVDFKDAAFDGF